MFSLILTTLLPVLVVFSVGYLAGYQKELNDADAKVLIRFVMRYALPLSIFCGVVTIPRTVLFTKLPLLIGLFIGMVLFYGLIYLVVRFVFRQHIAAASIISFAITGPAVPFIGVTVLGNIFGTTSLIPVSIASLFMNVFQVPVTIMLLSWNKRTVDQSSSIWVKLFYTWKQLSLYAIKKPVVYIPLIAFALVVFNIKVAEIAIHSLELLGKTTGGVALFASGVILYHKKVVFNFFVGAMVLCKNLLIPALVGTIMFYLNVRSTELKEIILTTAIPTATIVAIFAIDYNIMSKEIASVLFFSTVFSFLTIGFYLMVLK